MKRFWWFLVLVVWFSTAGCKSEPVEKQGTGNKISPLQEHLLKMDGGFSIGHWHFPYSADAEQLARMNRQFVDVEFKVPLDGYDEDDLGFLRSMIQAGSEMNLLFWQQSSSESWFLRSDFETKQRSVEGLTDYESQLYRLLMINYGRYDSVGGNVAFLGLDPSEKKWLGANFYPADLTKEQFEGWVKAHPEDKEAFESPYTVIGVRHPNWLLQVIPYSERYQVGLESAAKSLRKAAAVFADSPSMASFLNQRADAFLTNDYKPSDEAWVKVEGSKFEVVIGPYEVYEDELMGYKAAFETYIGVVDPKLSASLEGVKAFLPGMEEALPLDKKYKGYERAKGSPISVVDLLYSSGDARKGVQAIAFNLPNDEDVREKVGSKKVLLRNVMQAKFNKGMLPISGVVLAEEQQPAVTWDAFFWHTLLHEILHGMGPGKINMAGGETTVSKELKELYSTIEECKADALGYWAVAYLVGKGFLPDDHLETMAMTSLPTLFRSVRFGLEEAHGGANMVIYNFLAERGVYTYDAGTGRFMVHLVLFIPAITELASQLLLIEATGDYAAAKAFVGEYGQVTEEVRSTVARLSHLPVDFRPIYTTADELVKRQ